MNNSEKQRKIGIIIAVVLAILAVLYIGGLSGQLWRGYQNWLDNNGMDGEVLMEPPNFNPFYCIPKAFSADGIRGTGFVILAAGAIFLYIKFHDRFSSKHRDDRNYTRSDSGLYGTAAWMSDKEMKAVLGIAPAGKERGYIFGEKKGQVVYLPEDTHLSRHIAVFGSTGSRKSRGFIRPYLYGAISRGESIILTDPKTELYSDSLRLFQKHGYETRVFNLVEPQHGDSWNCMADIKGDTLLTQILTDVVITNTSNGKGDHFWDNGEGNFFKALCLLCDLDPSRGPDAKNLPAVYQLLTQNSKKSLDQIFNKLPYNHPAKAPYNLFAQASETVQAGIVLGLGTRLQVLQNEAIQRITSYSDIDLAEPGRRKCAYFIIIDDQHSTMEFLASLFFSFLFIKLVRYADSQPNKKCKVPVNVVFEELNTVGVIPDLPRKLSSIRSRSLQCVLVNQNLGQLQNRYPDNQWLEILGNCDSQIMMGCNDQVSADYWSLRSGDQTVEVEGTMTVRKTIAVAQVIPQYRHTEGKGKRRLLTADEVLRLPENEVLVALRGQNLLKLNKFDYPNHPMAKEIEMVDIHDYQPRQRAQISYAPQTEVEEPAPKKQGTGKKPRARLFGEESPPLDF